MKTQTKLDILMLEINEHIEIAEKRRKRHKRKAYRLKLYSITGSAVITVLLGLKSIHHDILSDFTLVLSALITIFNGIEGFYNHRGLWVKDVKSLARLKVLKRDLEFYIAGESKDLISPEILTRYKNRLESICNEDVKTWINMKEDQIESEIKAKDS